MKKAPMRTGIDTFNKFTANGLVEPCGYCQTEHPAMVIDPIGGAYRIRVVCSANQCKLTAPLVVADADKVEEAAMSAISAWNMIAKLLTGSLRAYMDDEGETVEEQAARYARCD